MSARVGQPFVHEDGPRGEGAAGEAVTPAGEPIGALAARCTPADELDPETYERLLVVLDRMA
jgi:hypothetical protein